LAFQSFDNERAWSRLFQKRVVHTKFNIYVFISRPCILLLFHLFLVVSNFIDKQSELMSNSSPLHPWYTCKVSKFSWVFVGNIKPQKLVYHETTMQQEKLWVSIKIVNSNINETVSLSMKFDTTKNKWNNSKIQETYVVNRKSAIKDWKVLLNILKSDWRLKKKCCERLK
jgi:hypothetical protein